MRILEFKVKCKSCLKTDDISRSIPIMSPYSNFIENGILKSEYQIQRYLKNNLSKKTETCQFCQSYNLQISDIEFGGEKAMCGHEVVQFQLKISKEKNGEIYSETYGTRLLPNSFVSNAFKLIENAIANTSQSEFEEKQIGYISFVVSISGLEQFNFVGFSIEEIMENVKDMKTRMLKTNS